MAARSKPDDDFDPDREPVALGDAAAAAIGTLGDPSQEPLDGTEFAKVKFVGMAFDSLRAEDARDEVKIGDELTFIVRARCVGTGDEANKRDGSIRHIVKMDVQSVIKKDDSI